MTLADLVLIVTCGRDERMLYDVLLNIAVSPRLKSCLQGEGIPALNAITSLIPLGFYRPDLRAEIWEFNLYLISIFNVCLKKLESVQGP